MRIIKSRRTAIIATIMVLFLIAGFVVYAEYIKSSRAKRVLATRGDEGTLFSSNYLVPNANTAANIYKRVLYTNSDSSTVSGDVTICNYAQGNPTKKHENDIPYTLTARLVMLGESNGAYVKTDASASDVGAHWVKLTLKGGATVTLNASALSHDFTGNTLDHRVSQTDICNVEFDSDFINAPALCLYLCATPAAGAPADVGAMDAVFSVSLSNAEARNTWEGRFNENNMTGTPAQPEFDGFNYVISGTGAGTCVLTWDNTRLQISQVFLNKYNFTPTVSGGVSSVTFAVDSDDVARYDLQFYYADGAVRFTDWSELTGGPGGAGCVTLTYTEG